MSCDIERKHRSRPIELHVPMQIIFEDKDRQKKSFSDESNHSSPYSKKKEDIPVPGVRIIESYEEEIPKIPPFLGRSSDEYIKYTPHIDDASGYYSRIPEYGVDDEDIEWIKQENFSDIDEGDFELIFDVLEKESIKQREFRQVIIDSTIESEDDVPCCVCGDRDYTDNNLIIFCDGCNLAIHQACQDLEIVPVGEWLCDSCEYYRSLGLKTDEEKANNIITCIMCKKSGDAFKRTNQNSFIHIICALMTSEIYFENNCINIDYLDPERSSLVCDVCNEMGGCVQCHVKTCFKSFHAICARNNGQVLLFDYYQEEDCDKNGKKKKEDVSPFQVLCPHHSAIHRSKQLEEMRLNSKNVKVELGRFIDKSTLKQCRSIVGKKISKETFNKICDYWKAKRLRYKNGRVPFIYQLNVVIEFEKEEFDSGLKLKNRPSKEEIIISQLSTEKKFLTMVSIRQYLEKLRLVLDVVRKREILKRRKIKVLEEILEKGELSSFNNLLEGNSSYKKQKKLNKNNVIIQEKMEIEDKQHININESSYKSPTNRSKNNVKKQTLMTQYLTSI